MMKQNIYHKRNQESITADGDLLLGLQVTDSDREPTPCRLCREGDSAEKVMGWWKSVATLAGVATPIDRIRSPSEVPIEGVGLRAARRPRNWDGVLALGG